jgi:hypothetical protein
MNSTILISPTFQSWLIPLDILMIICGILVVVLSLLYLLIIIFDKTCHTVPMMLVANTCILFFIYECNSIWMCLFTLQNDREQIQYQDSLCIFRAYICYASSTAGNSSYTIQALYRYVTAIYPAYRYWQTKQCQLLTNIFIDFHAIMRFQNPCNNCCIDLYEIGSICIEKKGTCCTEHFHSSCTTGVKDDSTYNYYYTHLISSWHAIYNIHSHIILYCATKISFSNCIFVY